MSKASFVVAFDGPGIDDHTIDVRDLAPALLSLGQIVDAANRALNGDSIPARVQAKAVSEGCFEVSLEVVMPIWHTIKGPLKQDDIESAKNLLEWLGLIGGLVGGPIGLVQLYRKLAEHKVLSTFDTADGAIRIEIDDDVIIVPLEVLRLYRDQAVNHAMNKLLDSVEKGGVDRIEFRRAPGAKADQIITAADRKAFSWPEAVDEPVVDFTRRMGLSIRSLAFQEGNKWRLFDGQNVITATIADQDFLARVDRSEVRFAKSDVLICDVKTVQRQGPDGLKSEHTIERVVEHRPAPRQMDMF